MKFLVSVLFFIYFINSFRVNGINHLFMCDFYFNPAKSIKPILVGKHDETEEVGCTINNPILGEIVFLICPKRKEGDYENMELVPSNCFASHLYSPYTAGKNEKDIEKLDIDKKYTHSFSYDDYEIKTFRVPSIYKHNKTIYCRCDNRKTEKEHNDKEKFQGKTGLVKIILSEKIDNSNILDFTDSNISKNKNIKVNGTNYEIDLVENNIFSARIENIKDGNFENCNDMLYVKFNKIDENDFSIRTPTIFFEDINCKATFISTENKTFTIVMKASKTENIEGCDFTKPNGDGIYKHGFVLNDISDNEKICTAYIGSSKKKIVAGIKCPYKLIPTYCFRHVLYEKEISGNKVFKTFLLEDILGFRDIEYYSNINNGSYIVGLPIKSERYAAVRCICENNGKRGIMELKIASSYTSFISFILLFITIILLYLS
ncbi:6-cysteine protein, putative [Plasmodium gallinaceum]|uniref:6-cysteine protein, putative n=1 Tax=Plasmodium gallinaceum TaxID=5849 RepID=A0A1J1GSB8_PLAGA|nr:6-cysteine protein, putative [Plasmodium gallinaceum]CRG95174.1 6-cysteine protein, putative [Plasmodium gallinaceum]